MIVNKGAQLKEKEKIKEQEVVTNRKKLCKFEGSHKVIQETQCGAFGSI